MRAVPLKAAAQYVGGLGVAAFFVVLLSFTFSFLGTLFCAALAGMMLGALRTHKWQCIPVSLIFPLVIFTLLKGMKTGLAERQVLIVSLACFSIFWLTYWVAAALFFFERKGRPAAVCPAPGLSVSAGRPGGESASEAAAVGGPISAKRDARLHLEMLQGNWSGEARAHPPFQSLRMNIQDERLTLCAVDASGQVSILGRAQLKLHASISPQTLELSEPVAQAAVIRDAGSQEPALGKKRAVEG